VIAVFTKYDQFRRNISIKLEDQHRDPALLDAEVEKVFDEHYLGSLTERPPFVRLERMHNPGQQCNGLIEMTANALSDGVVALMLFAVQAGRNLELNIAYAIGKATSTVEREDASTEEVMKLCILAFPSLWIHSEYWEGRQEALLKKRGLEEFTEFEFNTGFEINFEKDTVLVGAPWSPHLSLITCAC